MLKGEIEIFTDAIEKVAPFTCSLHAIQRYYGSKEVHSGIATFIIVNDQGWALTCKHVARLVPQAIQINKSYMEFNHLLQMPSPLPRLIRKKELERKYGFKRGVTAEIKLRFPPQLDFSQISIYNHPTTDLALIKFSDFTTDISTYPVFPKEEQQLRPGMFLCRLGYPFPEFNNYTYDEESKALTWTETGIQDSPLFPTEGMLTRHIVDKDGARIQFELSTPGLKGQSGGPAFDSAGRIWGIQSETVPRDMNMDVEQDVIRQGKKKKVKESAFLHLGYCIDIRVIKRFMLEHSVDFQEE